MRVRGRARVSTQGRDVALHGVDGLLRRHLPRGRDGMPGGLRARVSMQGRDVALCCVVQGVTRVDYCGGTAMMPVTEGKKSASAKVKSHSGQG